MQTNVETIAPQSGKFPQALIWIAGIALTLFCAVGIAAIMGWIPNSIGGAGDKVSVMQAPASAAVPAVAPAAVKPQRAAAPRPAAEPHPAPAARPAPMVRVDPVAAAPAPMAAMPACAECGVIESVREIEEKGAGSGIGAVGGAVLGGLLGNQVGGGRGQDVMTVVGAVGGGLAGNEVEKRVKSTKRYEITLRLNDGTTRVVSESGLPAWRVGDKVKLVNGAIRSNA